MDIYVARQPIFDRQQKIFGYELLYRSGQGGNVFDGTDGTQATLAVIRNTFLVLGQQTLTGSKKAFINFTKSLLLDGVAHTLPSDSTVIEILEDVEPDATVLDACQALKEAGYLLALDDFTVDNEVQQSIVEIADIIKADFMRSTPVERATIVTKFSDGQKRFLGEKVETREEFTAALDMGYTYFQGYFFAKPVIVSGKDIPGYKLNYMRVLQEVNRKELEFSNLEKIIKQDTSLVYTLLNYINSAYFGLREQITSILHAMVLLGEREVRKWASLVLFTFLGDDKPTEVVVTSLVRARFCESLAPDAGLQGCEDELFLLGMFSMIDVIMGRPLPEILESISIAKDVKAALLGEENVYRDVYNLVTSYEAGEWEQFSQCAAKLHVSEEKLPELYVKAVEWADGIASMKK